MPRKKISFNLDCHVHHFNCKSNIFITLNEINKTEINKTEINKMKFK